jgi:hypothetical protein
MKILTEILITLAAIVFVIVLPHSCIISLPFATGRRCSHQRIDCLNWLPFIDVLQQKNRVYHFYHAVF